MSEQQQERPHWSMDRRVNVGHVLTTVLMAVSVMFYVTTQDKRVSILEHQIAQQALTDKRQDDDLERALGLLTSQFADLRTDIRAIRQLLDRDRGG